MLNTLLQSDLILSTSPLYTLWDKIRIYTVVHFGHIMTESCSFNLTYDQFYAIQGLNPDLSGYIKLWDTVFHYGVTVSIQNGIVLHLDVCYPSTEYGYEIDPTPHNRYKIEYQLSPQRNALRIEFIAPQTRCGLKPLHDWSRGGYYWDYGHCTPQGAKSCATCWIAKVHKLHAAQTH